MDPVAWASQASKRRRVYELNGAEGRTPVAVGTFRVVPEQDLDPSESKRQQGPGLMHDLEDLTCDVGRRPRWTAGPECVYCRAIAILKRSSGAIRWS